MTIPQAIEKAVEGGWAIPRSINDWEVIEKKDVVFRILLDPAFWQALGKTEGWYELNYKMEHWPSLTLTYGAMKEKTWLAYWHRMIDALASGQSLEEFFANLNR